MNILLINGSPRGEKSNTLKLSQAFIDGIREAKKSSVSVETLTLNKMKIEHCIGCFACWEKSSGVCIIDDDMPQVLEKLIWADVIIWSFPLYSFSVPALVKDVLDRKLPINTPFMVKDAANGGLITRVDMRFKRHVLVSTCGFYTTTGNYDAVKLMFERSFGTINCENIFCAQGGLFTFPELSKRTDKYLSVVKKAGGEYIKRGFSPETRKELNTTLFTKDIYEQIANINWGIEETTNESIDASYPFVKRVAALYTIYMEQEKVLELDFTDINKQYQLVLGNKACDVLKDNFKSPTTTIKIKFDDFRDIMYGKQNMVEAYEKQLYTVTGDTEIIYNWDKYFG